MASKNDITGDLIKSKSNSKSFDENFDKIFPEKIETLTDGTGKSWQKCGRRCWLDINENGAASCNKPNCTLIVE